MMRNLIIGATLALVAPGAVLAQPTTVADSAKGKILTTAQGMALYTFSKDSTDHSACDGGCASLWPPLKATPADQASGTFSIFKRADGTLQWAHQGSPLYTFSKDTKPNQVTGDGFNNVWHVARPAGDN
ncbi:hypothetical protein SDC9_59523 [bioreactor metagenome]|uniref:Lipoprotein with Yx(FWY)xxD motif n=1 Tax=bioreactor metagenome TaxID=1076179 RepID=A0A644XBM3_9ZZZZ